MHPWVICQQPLLKRPKVRAHGFGGSIRLLGLAQALLSPCFRGFGSEDREMLLEILSVSDSATICVSCHWRFHHDDGQVQSGGACDNEGCFCGSRDSW